MSSENSLTSDASHESLWHSVWLNTREDELDEDDQDDQDDAEYALQTMMSERSSTPL